MSEQIKNRPVAPKVIITIAVVVLTAAAVAVVSLAVYTDNESVSNNTISSGTIDLTALPATAAVSMTAITPGDQVTAPITIGNAGDVPLRYAMTSTTTEDTLASALTFTVKSGVATCTDAGFGASGNVEYAGILGSTATSAILGDVTQGSHPGDRSLAPAANEVLCLNVRLPVASGNISQGQATTATLTFAAEQTTNNP